MANDENLIPPSKGGYQFTQEDRIKGGIKSGEAKKRRKRLREILEMLLDKKMRSGELADLADVTTIDESMEANLTAKETLALNLMMKAMAGDMKAMEYVLKLIDEYPKDDAEGMGQKQVIILGGEELLE